MYKHEITTIVRYAETDQMGYVYYGRYPEYLEMARTAMIKSLGLSYRTMEEGGVMLPVAELNIKYKQPAFYDDQLTIKSTLTDMPTARIVFVSEIYKEDKLCAVGTVTLCFVDKASGKIVRCPKDLSDKLKPYF